MKLLLESGGNRTSLSRRSCLSVIAVAAGAVLTTGSKPVRAERPNYDHIINLAGRQRMLSQRMSKEIMLIALQYNVRENVRNLGFSSDEFGRVLHGLRYGDRELALPATAEESVLQKLSKVENLWPAFKALVADAIAAKKVKPSQIESCAEANLPLLEAMDDTVKAYESVASAGHLPGVLAIAINLAGAQRMLTQKASKEFYLVALDHDAATNRVRLGQSVERFERVLRGLLAGDGELRLIAAPTAPIQAQLRTVERLWTEFRPMMSKVRDGGPVGSEMIAETASLNLALLGEMNTAVNMYEGLKPA